MTAKTTILGCRTVSTRGPAGNPLPSPLRDTAADGKHFKPDWQSERAAIVHRACQSVQRLVDARHSVAVATRRTAARFAGRPFKCDPSRRLALSALTLRRAWNKWRMAGQVPSALRQQFRPVNSTVSALVLCQFIDLCAKRPWPSLAAAWTQFSRAGGVVTRGRRLGAPVGITYSQAARYFPAAHFRQLQAELVTIQKAGVELNRLRLAFQAGIRSRLPDKVRLRQKRGIDFQI